MCTACAGERDQQRALGTLYFDVTAWPCGLGRLDGQRPVADALVQAGRRIEPLGQAVGGGADECLCGHTSSKPHATQANLNRR